jgi:hypothetical protein
MPRIPASDRHFGFIRGADEEVFLESTFRPRQPSTGEVSPVSPGLDDRKRDLLLARKGDPGRMRLWETDQRPDLMGGKEMEAGAVCLGNELNMEVKQCPS